MNQTDKTNVVPLHIADEANPAELLVYKNPYGDSIRTELLRDVLLRKSSWITPHDIIERRAYVYLSGDSKIELCHKAGAPFTDDPTRTLHEVQRDFLHRTERELILMGGSRLGKSVLGGCAAFAQLSIPGQRIAIVADTYDHCYHEFAYAFQAFDKVFGEDAATIYDFLHHGNQHKMQIDTVWDSTLQVFSMGNDFLDSILGSEWDLVIAAEGSKIPADIINTKVWRALLGRSKVKTSGFRLLTGRLFAFTTPDGEFGYPNYRMDIVDKMTRGKFEQYHYGNQHFNYDTKKWEPTPWETSVYIRTEGVLANPAYSREDFESAKRLLGEDSAAFQEQFMGRVVRRTGTILNRYNQDEHRSNLPNRETLKRMRFGVGVDFGKNFGAVLVAHAPDGTFYVLGEVFNVEKLTSENAREIKKMCIRLLGPMFGHSQVAARPEDMEVQWNEVKRALDSIYVDSAGQQKDDLQSFLNYPLAFEAKPDVVASLNQLNELFGARKLFLETNLYFLPDEIKNLVWKPTKRGRGALESKEEPSGARHVCDALRYILVPMFRMGAPKGETKAYSWDEAYKLSQMDPYARKLITGETLPNLDPPNSEFEDFFD